MAAAGSYDLDAFNRIKIGVQRALDEDVETAVPEIEFFGGSQGSGVILAAIFTVLFTGSDSEQSLSYELTKALVKAKVVTAGDETAASLRQTLVSLSLGYFASEAAGKIFGAFVAAGALTFPELGSVLAGYDMDSREEAHIGARAIFNAAEFVKYNGSDEEQEAFKESVAAKPFSLAVLLKEPTANNLRSIRAVFTEAGESVASLIDMTSLYLDMALLSGFDNALTMACVMQEASQAAELSTQTADVPPHAKTVDFARGFTLLALESVCAGVRGDDEAAFNECFAFVAPSIRATIADAADSDEAGVAVLEAAQKFVEFRIGSELPPACLAYDVVFRALSKPVGGSPAVPVAAFKAWAAKGGGPSNQPGAREKALGYTSALIAAM